MPPFTGTRTDGGGGGGGGPVAASAVTFDDSTIAYGSGANVQEVIDSAFAMVESNIAGIAETVSTPVPHNLTFVVNGGAAAPTVGVKPTSAVRVPWACTVVGWHLYADAAGSIVLDVLRDTHANFPPTDGDRIAGTARPTLATAQMATSTTLTGWTTALAADDVLVVEVESASVLTQATLVLEVTVP